MNELLKLAVKAHGGLERWNKVKTVRVAASMTGAIWYVSFHLIFGDRSQPRPVTVTRHESSFPILRRRRICTMTWYLITIQGSAVDELVS